MKHPTFDAHGYPTDETLEAIRTWPWKDALGLFTFLKEAWHFPDYFRVTPHQEACWGEKRDSYQMLISTGGWSGNESLIAAVKENQMIMAMCWYSSKRGGHYEFRVHKDLRHPKQERTESEHNPNTAS